MARLIREIAAVLAEARSLVGVDDADRHDQFQARKARLLDDIKKNAPVDGQVDEGKSTNPTPNKTQETNVSIIPDSPADLNGLAHPCPAWCIDSQEADHG